MKARYLTNSILSFARLLIFIILIVLVVKAVKTYGYYDRYGNWIPDNTTYLHTIFSSYTFLAVIYIFIAIASFVMGIVTLSMEKGEPRGLGIASGVIAIIPYASVFAGGIVSMIAFIKCS